MTTLRLHGTETSPYVRRVRIVAHELGVPVTLVDATTDDGQDALRAVNPLWKVPAGVITTDEGEHVALDSASLSETLLRVAGPGPLAAYDATQLAHRNQLVLIDGALDALINTMYLGRDGVTPDDASYLAKHRARAASACAHLETMVQGERLSGADAPHLVDIALGTTIGWMLFRATYPIAQHPNLMRCYHALAARPSFEATRPPGS